MNIEVAVVEGVGVAVQARELTREAFVALVERYNDDLLRLAFAMAGDADLAADAVQACWQAAWQSRAAVGDPGKIRAWLFTVTANNVRRQLRRRRLGRLLTGRLPEPKTDRPPDPGFVDLGRALERLSPDDRLLVALRFDVGMTSEEIGAVLGLSGPGTRRRLQRIVARLRQELGDE